MKLNRNFVLLSFLIIAVIATRSYTLFNNYMLLDDLNQFLEAKKLYSTLTLPVTGPSLSGSSALIPGGGYYLLLAIPGLLFNKPVLFSFYTGILMLSACALFLFSVRKHYGNSAALVVASLLLFSPRMFTMESSLWNPHYAVILSLIMASILIEIFSGKDHPILLFLLLPLSALMSQVHLTAFFYLPEILAVYFLFFYRGRNRGYFWLGIIGAVLLYLPYLGSEISNGFSNTRAVLAAKGDMKISIPILTYLILFPSLDVMASGVIPVGMAILMKVPWFLIVFSLPVYFLSLVFSASSYVFFAGGLYKIVFRKDIVKFTGEISQIDRNLLIFFTLVAVGLSASFLIFGIPSHPIHYYYPIYAFSFFPVMLLLRRLSDFRVFNRVLAPVAAVIFIIAGSELGVYDFFHGIRPYSMSRQPGYVIALLKDAGGRNFSIKTEYQTHFYELVATELLHEKWNFKENADLKYILDKKENMTNTGQAVLLYGDDRMGLYRLKE